MHGSKLTYGELDAFPGILPHGCNRVASARTRVAIMLPNVLQYPIAMSAVLRQGAIVVNVNPLYTPRELEHQLKDSGAEVIVILENFATVLQAVVKNTAIKHIVVGRWAIDSVRRGCWSTSSYDM